MDDSRSLSLAVRAIRDADVRFGILPSQSRFCEDDEVTGMTRLATANKSEANKKCSGGQKPDKTLKQRQRDPEARTSSSARLAAAIKLPASATPLPARFSAVP